MSFTNNKQGEIMIKLKSGLLILTILLLGCESKDFVTGTIENDRPTTHLGMMYISTNGGYPGSVSADTIVSVPPGTRYMTFNFNADTDGGFTDFIAILSLFKNNVQITGLINAEYINGFHKYTIEVLGIETVSLHIKLFCDGGGLEPCDRGSYLKVSGINYLFY